MKKVISILMIIITCLMYVSCQSLSERYARINQIFPEVDYGYISYNNYNLSKNREHMSFVSKAEEILGISSSKLSYPYHVEITDEYIYFLIEYKNKNHDYFNLHSESNEHLFDIGLFRTDIYSMETELLYRFTEVYPFSLYQYTMANTYFNVKDDQYLLFCYNGKIELFNIELKEVIFEEEVYDKLTYVNSQNYPYRVNEYGDFYAIIDDNLILYHYFGNTYQLMEFPAVDSFDVERYDDYLLLSKSTDSSEYQYAYSLEQNAAVDINIALAYKDSLEDKLEQLNFDFVLNDIAYEYSEFNGELTISQVDSEFKVIISYETMMENNETFKAISESWNQYSQTDFAPVSLKVVEDKLLIIFMNPDWGGYKPAFIFEYDPETQMSYYVGYHYNHIPDKIIILDN